MTMAGADQRRPAAVRGLPPVSLALAALLPVPALAQQAAEPPIDPIVITARKRPETALDVPIAVTAISGETLARRNIHSVREAAILAPGLTISSDGTGRAFVSIRGIGVTLVQSVQPGVGLFVDGIYRPNTAYLNSPLLDVERIEVLRGPQGTLYGKNTLGGAINVITRQPGEDFAMRGSVSYAGPDHSGLLSASLSAPIVPDRLAIRIGGSHRQQDGFIANRTIGGRANSLNSDSLNTTIRATPAQDVTITLNGYYDWVKGTNSPYVRVTGPTDYARDNRFDARGTARYRYRGLNARIETALDAIDSQMSLQIAYDARNGHLPDSDGDFGPSNPALPIPAVRQSTTDRLRTSTAEWRVETAWDDRLSTLVGLFYSRETTRSDQRTHIAIPLIGLDIRNRARNATTADTYAAFGTLFWKPDGNWDISLGLRYDHEDRAAIGLVNAAAPAPIGLTSDQVAPRLSITRHWTPALMTYASVARGYRGGGFNAMTAPVRVYRGDSAWTYEVGAKYASPDQRLTLSGALFHNDYRHYIGLNSIAPASTGGVVTVDLNTGDVESHGAEIQWSFKPVARWTLSGGLIYMRARITDAGPYTAVTGRTLSSDRLTFQPDWMATVSSDYGVPLGNDADLTFNASLHGKGSRLAATLNQTVPTFLKAYVLADGSITWRRGGIELALFGTNLFNRRYFDAYIERTTLVLARLPASDLGIIGDLRRYGVRAAFRF